VLPIRYPTKSEFNSKPGKAYFENLQLPTRFATITRIIVNVILLIAASAPFNLTTDFNILTKRTNEIKECKYQESFYHPFISFHKFKKYEFTKIYKRLKYECN